MSETPSVASGTYERTDKMPSVVDDTLPSHCDYCDTQFDSMDDVWSWWLAPVGDGRIVAIRARHEWCWPDFIVAVETLLPNGEGEGFWADYEAGDAAERAACSASIKQEWERL